MSAIIQAAATIQRVQSSLSSPQIPFTLSKQCAVYFPFIQHPYLLNATVKLLLQISSFALNQPFTSVVCSFKIYLNLNTAKFQVYFFLFFVSFLFWWLNKTMCSPTVCLNVLQGLCTALLIFFGSGVVQSTYDYPVSYWQKKTAVRALPVSRIRGFPCKGAKAKRYRIFRTIRLTWL